MHFVYSVMFYNAGFAIVYPHHTDPEGQPVSSSSPYHPQHHLRVRRSANNSSQHHHKPLYILINNTTEGDLRFKLHPNNALLAPQVKVHHRKDAFANRTQERITVIKDIEAMPCYYSGYSMDQSQSRAALNLCGGMVSPFFDIL